MVMKKGRAEVITPINRPWLVNMVQAKFYENCNKHSNHENTLFCTDCQGTSAFCELCQRNDELHEGHRIIKVYRASRQTAVRISDIRDLMETKRIHDFSINSRRIYYVKQRLPKDRKPSTQMIANMCKICRWSLKNPHDFCSLQCYSENLKRLGMDAINIPGTNDEDLEVSSRRTTLQKLGPSNQISCMKPKHRRKGTPRRSPMF